MKNFAKLLCLAMLLVPESSRAEYPGNELHRKIVGFYQWANDVVVSATINEQRVVIRVKEMWSEPVPESYRHAFLIYLPCIRFESEIRKLKSLEVDVRYDNAWGDQNVSATAGYPGGRFCDTVDAQIERLVRTLK